MKLDPGKNIYIMTTVLKCISVLNMIDYPIPINPIFKEILAQQELTIREVSKIYSSTVFITNY